MSSSSISMHSIAALVVLVHLVYLGDASLRGAIDTPGEVSSGRTVETQELQSSIQSTILASMFGGAGSTASQRSARIERSVWESFQALPKNSMGRIAPRAVRYMVHSYFAKEHGWLIEGIELDGMQRNASEVHEAKILQDKAPALVEALLEAHESNRGLSLADVVVMIAVLEQLITTESLTLLEASYFLNDLSSSEQLEEDELHKVLSSYLLIFEMGPRANLTDGAKHQRIKKALARRASPSWQTVVSFETDAVSSYGYAQRDRLNPFMPNEFSFQAASEIVLALAHDYGKWQNHECHAMKEHLMELSPFDDGRVPMQRFWSQPVTSDYKFAESLEYLRTIGAVDETGTDGPKVIIPNYLSGPSNCIASSSYFSVCCLSDCHGIMAELEGKIHAPVAPPQWLFSVLKNLSSVDTEIRNPDVLAEKLNAIADRHNGEVPLHSRLFAQWLHHAFPNDCPYPHIAEDSSTLSPSFWDQNKAVVSSAEMERHLNSTGFNDTVASAEEEAALLWSDEEVLPLLEVPKSGRSFFGHVVRVAVQLAMFCVLIRIAFTGLRSITSAAGGDAKVEKTTFQLPLHM